MPPTYEFYTDSYFGNQIAEADFSRLTARASAFISGLQCDLSSVPDDTMKNAICSTAEAWQINEQGGEIVSQTVGSWSKSFATKPMTNDQRLIKAANLYLKSYCDLTVRWA